MTDLQHTDTNSGDDSAGRVFGLDGNLYLGIVIAAVAGIALFAGLTLFGSVGYAVAGGVGVVPVAVMAVWAVALKQGKPAGYDRDRIEALLGGGDFTRGANAGGLGRTHAQAPEGRFVRDMLVFGSPERGGLAARGFRLEPPDLRGASFGRLNAFQEQVRSLLALAVPGRRLQFQWVSDSDYRAELLAYHERTQAAADPVVRRVRNERFARYWPRMTGRTLRREHLALFLSIEIEAQSGFAATRRGLEVHYDALLAELAGQFAEFEATVRAVFGPELTIRPMDDAEHFRWIHRFLNPGFAARAGGDAAGRFDPALTIQENCWHGEGVGQADGGFFLDGNHHAILTLARWPQRTRPGIVTHLTGLPFLDYTLTVNVTPVAAKAEIGREETAAERLRGEYAGRPRPSLLVALRKKERKVEALAGGFARPFRATYVVRVWAPEK
jgi:hypothetical protein